MLRGTRGLTPRGSPRPPRRSQRIKENNVYLCRQPIVWTVPTLLAVLAAGFTLALAANSAQEVDKSDSDKFHKILHDEWQRFLKDNPTFASELGDRRYNGKWPDVSLKAFKDRRDHQVKIEKELKKLDLKSLSPTDKIDHALFLRKVQTEIDATKHQIFMLALNQREGIQSANILADSLRFETVQEYEDWLARLEAFPDYMDQTIALLKKGIQEKIVHARVVMERVPAQIAQQIVKDPEKSLFFKPFHSFPKDFKASVKKQLSDRAKKLIAAAIVPAYEKFETFFQKEYLPACFDRVGVWQMKNGQAIYDFCIRRYTTTNLTAKQIHDLGLKEVARIKKDMLKVTQQVKFKGDFKEFLADLRTNPKFFYKTKEELLAAYAQVCKKIDAALPRLFSRLPKTWYTIKPIPMSIAPDTTTAYYQPPAADGSRGGIYYVNLYKPEARPKYEIEALSLHEAVPGHHLQIALAMELKDLPDFRRYDYDTYTAFVEGWALYSEKLGEELGLYDDPYSKFGQLTYQMWRACRLVVDTGMHAFEWTRQQAVDFMVANTPKTQLDIENETDRYIAWPGQALAYKIGELKFNELRARATSELGKKFDVREFHSVVLSGGAVTLDVLDGMVDEWIASKKAK
jgi:prolyl oligopeptidase